jgi:hypothetical protein
MASTIAAGTTSGTAIAIAGDTSGVLQLQTNGTTAAVTIDTSQNVGIGTSSPATKLEVSFSSAGTTIAGSPVFTLKNTSFTNNCVTGVVAQNSAGGNAAGIDFINVNQVTDGGGASGSIGLWTNASGTKAYRIYANNSGNVGIGTSSPGQKLTVIGDVAIDTQLGVAVAPVSASGIKISAGLNSGDGGNPRSCILCNTSQSPGSNPFILFTNLSNNTAGSITHTGTTTVAYNTSSDYRLKENIAPMTGALAKVAQLKPCTYTWKEDGTDGQGFIAHELQEVISDCVSGEKDAVNADGSIKPQGVDTSFLVATLTAAIQELNAKVDAQAVRIAELEGAR